MNFLKVFFVTLVGKFVMRFSQSLNLGHGSTWPGHIALKFYPQILSFYASQLKKGLVLVAGTNGKTTTVKMLRTILEKKGYKIVYNESGANLLNGIASAFLSKSNLRGNIEVDYAVFEVDEATLPLIINNLTSFWGVRQRRTAPESDSGQSRITTGGFWTSQNDGKQLTIVLLNLFRDQLDRYGEVDNIARKWKKALEKLPKEASVILNGDDPQVAFLGEKLSCQTLFFGLEDNDKFLKEKEHATDSVYCPSCGSRLSYEGIYYSHLGKWFCPKCHLKRPIPNLSHWKSPLPGLYNLYNTLAAVLASQSLGVLNEEIADSLTYFKPAFGRQEEFDIRGKKVKVFLAKNPVGVNEAIRTIISFEKQRVTYSSNEVRSSRSSTSNSRIVVVLALNDNIPDGRDVSWIWDVEYEELLPHCKKIICTGQRAYDMGLRIKYGIETQKSKLKSQNSKVKSNGQTIQQFNNLIIEENLNKAVEMGLKSVNNEETLYILPTYSAMLSVRKILGGRKIL
ncbi:MAG: Mur ligase family protein [Patescibacteria group bacterium]|nr:Mur ligase family protein [Patescibacteria group bacterium]